MKTKPKIVAVLEQCVDDSAGMFIIDLSKLDLSDPEIKEYHDAVLEGCKRDPDKNCTHKNVAFNYNSDERKWKVARVKPPCKIDAVSEIWEGSI